MSHRWGGARTQYAWKYPAPSAMNKTSCFSLPGGNHWAAVWRLFFFLWCLLNFYADSHPNGSGLIINQPGLGLDFFFFSFSGGNRCQGHTFKFLDTKMVRWEDVSLIFISFTEGWRDGGRRLQGMRTQHGWKQMKLWLICLMYINPPPHTHTHRTIIIIICIIIVIIIIITNSVIAVFTTVTNTPGWKHPIYTHSSCYVK